MANPNKQNSHRRDNHVSFDAETHTYSIKGSSEGVTSVTTLINTLFPIFDADAVIEKFYGRWQQNKFKNPEYYGKSKEQVKQMWKERGEAAAAEGTKLHAAIDAYFNNDEIDYDKEKQEWKYFLKSQDEYALTAHRTEMILWSEDHKLGGMIDLLVKNSDGTYSIYDWKRCKDKIWREERHWDRYGRGPLSNVKDNKYYRYSVQLNLYRELLERF